MLTTQRALTLQPQEGEVLTIVKTPGMMRAASVKLPAGTSIGESVQALLRSPVTSDGDRRFVENLRREVSGPHNFFTASAGNQMIEVMPQTKLAEVAVPRELSFPDGPRKVPCVAVEVVQYAAVGIHA